MEENIEVKEAIDNRPDSEKLNDCLEIFKIKHLEHFIDLNKYFDLEQLDDDSTPKIVCENKVCLIFDNKKFNETYLIDLINQYIEESYATSSKISEIEFIYIDDFLIKLQLFTAEINLVFAGQEGMDKFEKENLKPAIMTINPKINEISFFAEPFAPFIIDAIRLIFKNTKLME